VVKHKFEWSLDHAAGGLSRVVVGIRCQVGLQGGRRKWDEISRLGVVGSTGPTERGFGQG
jgi:hypothetical protein